MDYNIGANPYSVEWNENKVKEWDAKIIDSIFYGIGFLITKGHKI